MYTNEEMKSLMLANVNLLVPKSQLKENDSADTFN